MAHQCNICYNDFSWDPSAKDKSQLPVQSRVCSHVLCYTCMLSIYKATHPVDECTRIKLDCPQCRKKGAHDPFSPIISLPICDLLAERNCTVKRNPDLEQVSQEVQHHHHHHNNNSSSRSSNHQQQQDWDQRWQDQEAQRKQRQQLDEKNRQMEEWMRQFEEEMRCQKEQWQWQYQEAQRKQQQQLDEKHRRMDEWLRQLN